MEKPVRTRIVFVVALSVSGCSLTNDLDDYTGGRRADAAVDAPVDAVVDSSPPVDTGGDVAVDSAIPDTGAPDTEPVDTGADAPEDTSVGDTGPGDTGPGDTGPADTGPADTGPGDTGPDAPLGCHVVVNEVQVAGASASDEFVELYNPCAAAVAMSGWRLAYRSTSGTSDLTLIDLSGFTIPADGYLLFAGAGFTGTSDGSIGGATGALSGSAGGVAIRNEANAIVDSVGYGGATNAFVESSAVAVPGSGMSIARKPNGVDTNVNSADFAGSTPTPRASNGS